MRGFSTDQTTFLHAGRRRRSAPAAMVCGHRAAAGDASDPPQAGASASGYDPPPLFARIRDTRTGTVPVVTPPSADRRGPVVVIGAGMAGLGAAATLRRAGKEVVVLERLDQVGGLARSVE